MATFSREERIMRRVIGLARRGSGFVSPNPLVGAVLYKDGIKIGEGFHEKFGGPHAEVNAIGSVKNPSDLAGAELFVNLEPCNHFGKTPPCTRLIIDSGIKRVFISTTDPNPLVNGSGINALRQAGIEVFTGVMEKEGADLNYPFITAQVHRRPFFRVKVACTIDGRIATESGSSKWITGNRSRDDVQALRFESDAILTGSGTIRTDNPSLTIRKEGFNKQPKRIILDTSGTSPRQSTVFIDEYSHHTIVFTGAESGAKFSVQTIESPVDEKGRLSLNHVAEWLFSNGHHHVLVEAGSTLVSSLMDAGLVDELVVYIGSKLAGNGPSFFQTMHERSSINDSIQMNLIQVSQIENDIKSVYRPGR